MNIQLVENRFLQILNDCNCTYSLALDWRGHELSLHAEERRIAASLIKVPILLEAFRQYQEGLVDLSMPLRISEEDKVGGSGVLTHLTSHIQVTLKDLLTLMIVVSDNTATNIVIDKIGIENVNQLSTQLNCLHTSLARRLMDFEAMKAGVNNYTSAKDMVVFLRQLVKGNLLNAGLKKEVFNILRGQQFLNKIPNLVLHDRGDDPIIANKTGELPGVEHDVAIIKHKGEQVIVAILLTELKDNAKGRQAIGEIGKVIVESL